jgi:hypothetical protein
MVGLFSPTIVIWASAVAKEKITITMNNEIIILRTMALPPFRY